MAWESNRGLPLPIRTVHALLGPWTPVLGWLWSSTRRATTLAGLGLAATFLLVYPFDGPLSAAAISLRGSMGGDIRRTFETYQQFGDLVSCLLVAGIVWFAVPSKRGTVRGLAAAWIGVGLVVQMLKMAVGRPRPKFEDPDTILGPLGAYPIGPREGVWHAWEINGPISSDLWSMPSSHTSAAVVLAVYLTCIQPRLLGLWATLAAGVGFSRVLFGAHYPSDVLVGALIGLWLAPRLVRWGSKG